MASLKEVKQRISSVESTRKITSAMKMIASAKLRKAQGRMERFRPYQLRLTEIVQSFLSFEMDFSSPFAAKREVKAVALVVFSSNSNLCGAFNANAIRLLEQEMRSYSSIEQEHIHIYPIGKKIYDAVVRKGLKPKGEYSQLIDEPSFKEIKTVAEQLMTDFLDRQIDEVKLIYSHFKNTAVQQLRTEQFLPVLLPAIPETNTPNINYIVEPDKASVIASLLPKSLCSQLFAALLDSSTAEHAARTMAMQVATDNASDLLDELRIQYNKSRQQAITSELLDILSGQAALKGAR
ncbi:MAG: F0F1 ATP synthase subunit gamma [Bacteroidales bacterium]|jgi:F-type H+-transporting ATPase subunit gamma|nr:F0F1 ATP synthase subunit gamma [Bacteroidales bacterium]